MIQTTFCQGTSYRESFTGPSNPIAVQIRFDGVHTVLSKVSGSSKFEGSATVGYFFTPSGKVEVNNCNPSEIAAFCANVGKGERVLEDSRASLRAKKVWLVDGTLYFEYHGTITGKNGAPDRQTDSFWSCKVSDLVAAIPKLSMKETLESLFSASQQYIGKRSTGSTGAGIGDIVRASLKSVKDYNKAVK